MRGDASSLILPQIQAKPISGIQSGFSSVLPFHKSTSHRHFLPHVFSDTRTHSKVGRKNVFCSTLSYQPFHSTSHFPLILLLTTSNRHKARSSSLSQSTTSLRSQNTLGLVPAIQDRNGLYCYVFGATNVFQDDDAMALALRFCFTRTAHAQENGKLSPWTPGRPYTYWGGTAVDYGGPTSWSFYPATKATSPSRRRRIRAAGSAGPDRPPRRTAGEHSGGDPQREGGGGRRRGD